MPSVMLDGRHHDAGDFAMRSVGVDTSVELDRYIDRIDKTYINNSLITDLALCCVVK